MMTSIAEMQTGRQKKYVELKNNCHKGKSLEFGFD